MAYRFKRKEPVAKAIRRLGRGRIEHALERMKERNRAEAVHGARKEIKKARAVVRLIRTGITQKKYRQLTGRLRNAAALLAAPRDAYIKTKTLHDLAEHFKGRIAPASLRSVRTALRKACNEEMKRFESERTSSAVEKSLHPVLKTLEHLQVNSNGWEALGPGVKTAYRQGRLAYRTASKNPSPETFHEWRKRAKNLWYHVRLLHPVRPGWMEAMAGELKTLGEYLGVDHDLTVLRQEIEARTFGSARIRHALNRLIERRQQALQASALALGAGFYTEKPSIFRDRLAGYWQAWRHEKKARTRPAAATRPSPARQ